MRGRRRPRRARRAGSFSTRTIAAASPASSCGATSSPVSLSTTASGIPPARVATTARLRAMASSTADPSPSVIELIAKTIERRQQSQRVGPESGEHHVPLEAEVPDLPLERVVQLALADDDESHVGQLANDARRGGDQVALPLVRRQRGDVADDWRAVRQPERRMRVHARLFVDEVDVDAVMDDVDPVARDAVRLEDRGDRR